MKRKSRLFSLLSVALLIHAYLYAQKPNIDTNIFFKWPLHDNPMICPSGKYVAYKILNEPVGKCTVVLNSRLPGWKRSFICKSDNTDIFFDDSKAIFAIAKDTILVVTLGKDVQYFSGYSSYKASYKNNNLYSFLEGTNLLVVFNRKKITFKNVLDYNYTYDKNSILLQLSDSINSDESKLVKIDLLTLQETTIWQGKNLGSLIFNSTFDKIAFLGNDSILNFIVVNLKDNSKFSVTERTTDTLTIKRIIAFTKNNKNVIVSLGNNKLKKYSPSDINLKVWSYNDQKIQPDQIRDLTGKEYLGAVSTLSKRLIRLEYEREDWNVFKSPSEWGDKWLISQSEGDCSPREWWNPACDKKWLLVDIDNANKKQIPLLYHKNYNCLLSPNEEYIIYYDNEKSSYFCYYTLSDSLVEITRKALYSTFSTSKIDTSKYLPSGQRGIAGWDIDKHSVYIYDSNDIWKFDLTGKNLPLNLTNGFGRKNNLIFSFIEDFREKEGSIEEDLVITALNIQTKENGFYKLAIKQSIKDPIKLSMGAYIYYLPFYPVSRYTGMIPIKASSSNIYIVRRESSNQFPNYYTTSDFKSFNALSDLRPELNYNWVTSELHSWTLPDGKPIQGVLIKPENFDSTKKYPIIFQLYEKLSNSLNAYIEPSPICGGCTINPVYFASNGYLIFKPDIYYKPNESGKSALTSILSVVNYLSQFSWVDTTRMGIQGCSFGGYETNYIITHSQLFKAACTASGVSELISYYSGEFENTYTSFNYGQYRMTKDIWTDTNAFIESSPLFKVQNISTPLLLFHTTKDDAVDFTQGAQLYLVMRRLKKKVWLLEYGNGNHGVFKPAESMDFGLRMFQFFNHYLLKNTLPRWMKNGIRAENASTEKGFD